MGLIDQKVFMSRHNSPGYRSGTSNKDEEEKKRQQRLARARRMARGEESKISISALQRPTSGRREEVKTLADTGINPKETGGKMSLSRVFGRAKNFVQDVGKYVKPYGTDVIKEVPGAIKDISRSFVRTREKVAKVMDLPTQEETKEYKELRFKKQEIGLEDKDKDRYIELAEKENRRLSDIAIGVTEPIKGKFVRKGVEKITSRVQKPLPQKVLKEQPLESIKTKTDLDTVPQKDVTSQKVSQKVSSYEETPIDKFVSKVKKKVISPQKMSTLRKFFVGGERILERSGKSGKELSDLMKKQRTAEDMLRGKYYFRIKDALKGLNKEQRINVGESLEGLSKPKSPEEAKSYKILQNWLAKVGRKAETEGFEISVPTGKGLKKVPFKARENYYPRVYNVDKLGKGKQREKTIDHILKTKQARNRAEANKLLDGFVKSNLERKAANLEFARVLDVPGYEKDPLQAILGYAKATSKRFTEASHFGKKDEEVAKLIDNITNEGGDFMEAQRIFDYMVQGAPQNKFASAIKKLNIATKLSLSFILNSTQTTNTASVGGIRNATKLLFKSFTKEGKDFAEIAGVYDDLILQRESGLEFGKVVKAVMKPFTMVESFNRRLAGLAGKESAEQLAKKLKLSPDNKTVLRELKKLGLKPSKVLSGKLDMDDLYMAANKMAERTQFKVDPLDVPPGWKGPLASVIMQFKSFTFMQTKFVRDEILKEAAKGNLAPMVRFIAIAPFASLAAYKIRNLATARKEDDEAKGALDLRKWDKYMKVGGTFPTELATQAQFLHKTAQSEYMTPLQKGSRFAGTVGGPTASDAGKLISALENIPTKKKFQPKEDPYLLLKRQAVEKTPFVGPALKNIKYAYPEYNKPKTSKSFKKKSVSTIKLKKVKKKKRTFVKRKK